MANEIMDSVTSAKIDRLLDKAYALVPAAAQSTYESILIARYAVAAIAGEVDSVPYSVPREIAGILAHVQSCGRADVTNVLRGRPVTVRTVVHFADDYHAARAAVDKLLGMGINALLSSPRSGEFEVYYDAHTEANYAAAKAAGKHI